MINQSLAVLREKASANQIPQDIMNKVGHIVHDLTARNFVGANSVQTDLANTAWTHHKEWIKGVKVLIQLASKK